MNKRRVDGINQMLEKNGDRYRIFYHEPIKNGVCKPAFVLQSTTKEFNLSPNVYLDEDMLLITYYAKINAPGCAVSRFSMSNRAKVIRIARASIG